MACGLSLFSCDSDHYLRANPSNGGPDGTGTVPHRLLIAAVRLYFDAPWHSFVETLRDLPYLCRLRDLPEAYERAALGGDILLRAVLAPLGITGSDMPDGGFYLSVDEPLEK